jgi:hypothetical protein
VIKIITSEGRRSIDPGEVEGFDPVRVQREGALATIYLSTGERLTGLVRTDDLDALMAEWIESAKSRRHAYGS